MAKEQDQENPDNVQGNGEKPEGDGDSERMFTQDELDAVIGDRLKRERAKYDDYDDVKKQLAGLEQKAKERREAEMGEVEKLEARLADLQTEKTAIEARFQDTVIRNAVERAAIQANFHDPSEAYALVDLGDVSLGDDGEVTGVAEAVEELAESKLHLIKKPGKPDIDADKGAEGEGGNDEARLASIKRRYGL